jgi:hypothetical protein
MFRTPFDNHYGTAPGITTLNQSWVLTEKADGNIAAKMESSHL